MSSYHYLALCVADDLGLLPLLQGKPATTAMVAKDLSISLCAAEVFLGVMTSLGFLAEHQGRFGLMEVSRNYLLPQSPYYWGLSFRGLRNNPPTFERFAKEW